jgi:hypothetical protein
MESGKSRGPERQGKPDVAPALIPNRNDTTLEVYTTGNG